MNIDMVENISTATETPQLSFDSTSVMVNGKREFLVSGEFHYFRVPSSDWKRRMELFKAAGGNCIATYIPWIVHEPEEGKIIFGDRPERDLDAFLRLAKEEGLMVIARPGPYQYSELVNSGLPRWLLEKYPEILLKNPDGSVVNQCGIDYLHPVFLEKTRTYFQAVAKIIKPHLAVNGGPIVLTQLDNELTGIHVWFGYHPTEEYYENCAKYLEILKGYLEEDGITGPFCHNCGGAMMSATYKKCAERMGKEVLFGYDHYYGLFQGYAETPIPYYFFDALASCDFLHSWGYPPVGFEIQCGTIGDIPPILKEDLLACYMVNLAAGMKGINYYVFTGGPNFEDTGALCKVYDYQAPVGPDGEVRPTYEALKKFGAFVKAHPELLDAERLTSVRFGLEWQNVANITPYDAGFNRFGMYYALMQTEYAPEYYLLDNEIPIDDKPLVLAGLGSISEAAKTRVIEYAKKGGKLLIAPADEWTKEFADLPNVAVMKKTWTTQFFSQSEDVAKILDGFGAKRIVSSSNRNVFTTAYRLKDGGTGVFALNLRSGAQETTISLPSGGGVQIKLTPMSVAYRAF